MTPEAQARILAEMARGGGLGSGTPGAQFNPYLTGADAGVQINRYGFAVRPRETDPANEQYLGAGTSFEGFGKAYAKPWELLQGGIQKAAQSPAVGPAVSGIGRIADVLDRPGMFARSLLTLEPERIAAAWKGLIPGGEGLPIDDPRRTYGEDLLRKWGVHNILPRWRGPDPFENLSFLVEVALDPLTYLGGLGAATKAGSALKKGLNTVAHASRMGEKVVVATERLNSARRLLDDALPIHVPDAIEVVTRAEEELARVTKQTERAERAAQSVAEILAGSAPRPGKGAPRLHRDLQAAVAHLTKNYGPEALEWGETAAEQARRGQRALLSVDVPFTRIQSPRALTVAAPRTLERLASLGKRVKASEVYRRFFPVRHEGLDDILKGVEAQARRTSPEAVVLAGTLRRLTEETLDFNPRELLERIDDAGDRALLEPLITEDLGETIANLMERTRGAVDLKENLEREFRQAEDAFRDLRGRGREGPGEAGPPTAPPSNPPEPPKPPATPPGAAPTATRETQPTGKGRPAPIQAENLHERPLGSLLATIAKAHGDEAISYGKGEFRVKRGGKWTDVPERVLNEWAEAAGLPGPTAHMSAVARAVNAGVDVPAAVLETYPILREKALRSAEDIQKGITPPAEFGRRPETAIKPTETEAEVARHVPSETPERVGEIQRREADQVGRRQEGRPEAVGQRREPWEMTGREALAEENRSYFQAIQDALAQGRTLRLSNYQRSVPIKSPTQVRIAESGTIQVPEGRRWVALTDQGVHDLAKQAGAHVPSSPDRYAARVAAVRRAVEEGKPVRAEVLEEFAGEAWADEALAKLRGTEQAREMSLVQFLEERGVKDPGLEHGGLSPSGSVSKAARRAWQKRRDEEFARYREAVDEYRSLVDKGEILEPRRAPKGPEAEAAAERVAKKRALRRELAERDIAQGIPTADAIARAQELVSDQEIERFLRDRPLDVEGEMRALEEIEAAPRPTPGREPDLPQWGSWKEEDRIFEKAFHEHPTDVDAFVRAARETFERDRGPLPFSDDRLRRLHSEYLKKAYAEIKSAGQTWGLTRIGGMKNPRAQMKQALRRYSAMSEEQAEAVSRVAEAWVKAAAKRDPSRSESSFWRAFMGITKLPPAKDFGEVLTARTARAKGAVTFAANTKALIHLMQGADVSTALHEMSHVFRRYLPEPDHQIAARWAGADWNKAEGRWLWSREAEEKFARGFERYMRTGAAPSSGMKRIFEEIRRWMTAIYRKVRGTEIDVVVPREVREVYDRMLGVEAPKSPAPAVVRKAGGAVESAGGKRNYLVVDPELRRHPNWMDWGNKGLRLPGNTPFLFAGKMRKTFPKHYLKGMGRIKPNQAGGALLREVRKLTDEVWKVGRYRKGYEWMAPRKAIEEAEATLRGTGIEPSRVVVAAKPGGRQIRSRATTLAEVQGLRQSIAEGEMRLRSGVNAIGEKLSQANLRPVRETVNRERARLAELEGVLPSGPKQPWEMTRAEWETEFEKTQVNFSGTGGEQFGMGRATSQRGLGERVTANRARQEFLKMGLKDERVEGLQIPARHARVIRHAVDQGLPVPRHVLEEYRGEKWAGEAIGASLERGAREVEESGDIDWLFQERRARHQAARSVDEVLDRIKTARRADPPLLYRYREVDEAEAARLRAATGLDLAGYEHVVDEYGLRHLLKKHGAGAESQPNLVALTEADLRSIPEITASPDDVVRAETRRGLDGVWYLKRKGDALFVLEEVRTRQGQLAPVTMYKVSATARGATPWPPRGSTRGPGVSTSETSPGAPSLPSKSIPPREAAGKKKITPADEEGTLLQEGPRRPEDVRRAVGQTERALRTGVPRLDRQAGKATRAEREANEFLRRGLEEPGFWQRKENRAAVRNALAELDREISDLKWMVDRGTNLQANMAKRRSSVQAAFGDPSSVRDPEVRATVETLTDFMERKLQKVETSRDIANGIEALRRTYARLGATTGQNVDQVNRALADAVEAPLYRRAGKEAAEMPAVIEAVGESIGSMLETMWLKEKSLGVAPARHAGYLTHQTTPEGAEWLRTLSEVERARLVADANRELAAYRGKYGLFPRGGREVAEAVKKGRRSPREAALEARIRSPEGQKLVQDLRRSLPAQTAEILDREGLWEEVVRFNESILETKTGSDIPRRPHFQGVPLNVKNDWLRAWAERNGKAAPENVFTPDVATLTALRKFRHNQKMMAADMRQQVIARFAAGDTGRVLDPLDLNEIPLTGNLEAWRDMLVRAGRLDEADAEDWLKKAQGVQARELANAQREGRVLADGDLVVRPDGRVEIADWNAQQGMAGAPPVAFERELAEQILQAYSRLVSPLEIPEGLRLAHKLTNLWKASVTSIWPAFMTRNFLGDQISSWYDGVMPMGPAYWRSADLLLGSLGESVPRFRRFAKNLDEAIALGDGTELTGRELLQEASEHGVLDRGFWSGEIAEAISGTDYSSRRRPRGGALRFGPRGSLNPLDVQNFVAFRVGRAINTQMESVGRFAHFLDKRIAGDTAQEAALRVKKFRFDYGDLTDFERVGMRLVFPFWVWMKNNTMLQMEYAVRRPTKIATQMRLVGLHKPNEDKRATPRWFQETISIPWPWGDDKTGVKKYLIASGAPLEDMLRIAGPMVEGRPGRAAERTLSQMNPMAKGFLEQTVGKDLFTGEDLESYDRAYPILRHLPARAKQAIGFSEMKSRSGLPYYRANPRTLHILRNLPYLGRAYSTAGRLERSTAGPLEKAGEALGGFKLWEIDPQRAASQAARERIAEALRHQRVATGAVREGSYSYFVAGQRIGNHVLTPWDVKRLNRLVNASQDSRPAYLRRALEASNELLRLMEGYERQAA